MFLLMTAVIEFSRGVITVLRKCVVRVQTLCARQHNIDIVIWAFLLACVLPLL